MTLRTIKDREVNYKLVNTENKLTRLLNGLNQIL